MLGIKCYSTQILSLMIVKLIFACTYSTRRELGRQAAPRRWSWTLCTAPSTPRKSEDEKEEYRRKIRMTVDNLSWQWGLKLPVHSEGESPAKRSRTIENEIVSKIKFLCYRDAIDPLIEDDSRPRRKACTRDGSSNPKRKEGSMASPKRPGNVEDPYQMKSVQSFSTAYSTF